jgi:hypothetical protein
VPVFEPTNRAIGQGEHGEEARRNEPGYEPGEQATTEETVLGGLACC